MFCRSVSWLLCIFLVAATADDYSVTVSSRPPGIYLEDTDYLLENNDVGIDPEVTDNQLENGNVGIDPEVTDNQLENDNVAGDAGGAAPATPGVGNPGSTTPAPGVAAGRGGHRGGGFRRGPWSLHRAAAVESSAPEQVPVPLDLGALLDAGGDAVVTLVAGQTRIAAHRAVLAARAAVLLPAGGQLVKVIPDVEGPVLRRLAAFLYSRRAPPPRQLSDALQLLDAADRYGVADLRAECERQAAALLSAETAAATAVLAVSRNYTALSAAATAFIRENLLDVLATPGWGAAMRSHADQLIRVSQLVAQAPSGRRQCSRRRATTPPDPAVCSTASPLDLSISSLRSFPAEKKGALLIEAAKWGPIEELRALLAAGADAWTMDKGEYGRTALHWAAWNGDSEAVRALLDAGVDVNVRSRLLSTPLQLAAQGGHAEVVRLLLAECADPNTVNKWGWTPLQDAARHGHPEVAEALLEAGADAGARTESEGETPLEIARNAKNFKVAKVLLRTLGCDYQASQLFMAKT